LLIKKSILIKTVFESGELDQRIWPPANEAVSQDPSEWKSVYAKHGIKLPAKGCPRLNEVIREIARLGGFMDRLKNQPKHKLYGLGFGVAGRGGM